MCHHIHFQESPFARHYPSWSCIAGSHTSSHMVQTVLVVKSKGAKLNLAEGGPDPVRYFTPVTVKDPCDDLSTDGG